MPLLNDAKSRGRDSNRLFDMSTRVISVPDSLITPTGNLASPALFKSSIPVSRASIAARAIAPASHWSPMGWLISPPLGFIEGGGGGGAERGGGGGGGIFFSKYSFIVFFVNWRVNEFEQKEVEQYWSIVCVFVEALYMSISFGPEVLFHAVSQFWWIETAAFQAQYSLLLNASIMAEKWLRDEVQSRSLIGHHDHFPGSYTSLIERTGELQMSLTVVQKTDATMHWHSKTFIYDFYSSALERPFERYGTP